MTILFVHGIPETGAIWAPFIKALDLDEGTWLAPTYPGFGGEPRPVDFRPTLENYALWLTSQVDMLVQTAGQPIDIVGHDFGATLALRVASTQSDRRLTARAVPILAPGAKRSLTRSLAISRSSSKHQRKAGAALLRTAVA